MSVQLNYLFISWQALRPACGKYSQVPTGPAHFTMIQDTNADMKPDNSTKLEQSSSQSMAKPTSSLPEIAPMVSVGTGSVRMDTDGIDDAILRAQGHKAAMPRIFSAMSSLGLMFWFVFQSNLWPL